MTFYVTESSDKKWQNAPQNIPPLLYYLPLTRGVRIASQYEVLNMTQDVLHNK